MAGASMNDIKSRIKSVESTMQITKAMELVATSKLRRAKEKVERSRPYYETLRDAIKQIKSTSEADASIWSEAGEGKPLFVVIAGDRGLAGGYNANVFRLTDALTAGNEAIFLPIGKKAVEYYKHRKKEIFSDDFGMVSEVGVGESFTIAEMISEAFRDGKIGRVTLVYTKFVSMISQLPVYEELLPFCCDGDGCEICRDPIFEEDVSEMLNKIIPCYVGGIIYSAICEASASESGARRTSMNAANKNAAEMIDTLVLKYNRARQAVITREITEIVSGAEAL
ncbi:MAG: ATP synthase F1 subunit gamma [Ruminococcaceae bacterium]|nr:ATP synthase F1 subunit gamma [Oscillospiraceae bacterium]